MREWGDKIRRADQGHEWDFVRIGNEVGILIWCLWLLLLPPSPLQVQLLCCRFLQNALSVILPPQSEIVILAAAACDFHMNGPKQASKISERCPIHFVVTDKHRAAL